MRFLKFLGGLVMLLFAVCSGIFIVSVSPSGFVVIMAGTTLIVAMCILAVGGIYLICSAFFK